MKVGCSLNRLINWASSLLLLLDITSDNTEHIKRPIIRYTFSSNCGKLGKILRTIVLLSLQPKHAHVGSLASSLQSLSLVLFGAPGEAHFLLWKPLPWEILKRIVPQRSHICHVLPHPPYNICHVHIMNMHVGKWEILLIVLRLYIILKREV